MVLLEGDKIEWGHSSEAESVGWALIPHTSPRSSVSQEMSAAQYVQVSACFYKLIFHL